MDNLTPLQRHKTMSRIRSKHTGLEDAFFKLLREHGIAFKEHPKLFGKPNCQIGKRTLIFVDSDFWHGWRYSSWKERMPERYWRSKIERNMARDKKKFRVLRRHGFIVLRIWEHQLKKDPAKVIKRIVCSA
jgi:DNA mismatch endonuclease (patch repair protein)